MIGMVEPDPVMIRKWRRPLLAGLPVLTLVLDFVFLLVTYLVLTAVTPDLLGAVADDPARFAAWNALLRLPLTVVQVLVGWRRDPPERYGVMQWVVEVAWSVIAALIVFTRVADPGDANLWLLVAVTAAGPFLVPRVVAAPFRLLRRWRRHSPAAAPGATDGLPDAADGRPGAAEGPLGAADGLPGGADGLSRPSGPRAEPGGADGAAASRAVPGPARPPGD